MGTDDGRKINGKRLLLVRALRCVTHVSKRRWKCILPVLAIASFARLFIFSSYRILPSPELLFFDSFDPSSSDLGPSIPAQCKDVMQQVYRCQDEATNTIVLGCHRRWCNSFGHCNECAGIGDRFFNFGMHHIQHAYSGDYPGLLQQQIPSSILSGNNTTNKCNLKVQFDYPCHGLATLKSAIYQDPSGWLGELFRYRSYMKIGNSLQPQFLPHSSSPTTIVGHMMSNFDWHSATTRGSLPTKTADWSGCLFHAYFRPNYYLEDALQYHQKQLNGGTTIRNNDTAIISIHFRVGDGLSFKQLAISEDIRMSNGKTLEDGWEEMKQCAKELVNSSPEYSDKKRIRYVLASDSVDVKRLARNDADIEVYTTDVKPSNFRENPDKDADAWLELFLLSRQDGLVMNGVADMIAYRGRATYASKGSAFALLIEKIGFFRKDQVKVCKM
jgi:hypothetical protein